MLVDYADDEFRMLVERALPLTSVKTHNTRQPNEPVHAAAVQIQNKFRGWKGRKEFLMIRQRVIKIQAHVRGHQVRTHYRKILWSVGIVEKIILRWRRKGSGLRGFRLAADTEGTARIEPSKDDEYDFLKEGRKQTEERLQKTLARVKSMVQYPEARDQYHRLLNIVTEFQEAKRISAKDALDAEYFWNDPLPCDPKSLPKFESSHEFQTKKKRQQQRQQEEAAKRQKIQHPQQHGRLPPIQQPGQPHPHLRPGPNQPMHNTQPPVVVGPSHHYGKPRGPSGGPNRYPQSGNPSGGYNPNRGSQGGGYSGGPYPPQGRGPPPYPASGMPGPGPRGSGSGYGVGAPNYPQGGPYGNSGGGRGPNMMGGNRNQQQYGGWQQ